MTTQYIFIRVRASWQRDSLVIAAVHEDIEEFTPSTFYCWFVKSDPVGDQWGSLQAPEGLPMWLMGLTSYQRPGTSRRRMCGISAEGDVVFFDEPLVFEKIEGAGIASPDSKYYGRMEDICGIGDALFACGDGGQIYRRYANGEWRNLAPNLLQLRTPPAQYDMFNSINGPNENDVYIVGRFGKIFHYDGRAVTPLPSPVKTSLVKIFVETQQRIWISGADSALLLGNWRDGFVRQPGITGDHHFNSITKYEGKFYLASATGWSAGLYTYDNGKFEKVDTGLEPEIEQVNHVDAGAGFLWAVGLKDIIHFDGQHWERIDFPHNDPIR